MRHVVYQGTFKEGRLCEVLTWILPEARLDAVLDKRIRRALRRPGGSREDIVRSGAG